MFMFDKESVDEKTRCSSCTSVAYCGVVYQDVTEMFVLFLSGKMEEKNEVTYAESPTKGKYKIIIKVYSILCKKRLIVQWKTYRHFKNHFRRSWFCSHVLYAFSCQLKLNVKRFFLVFVTFKLCDKHSWLNSLKNLNQVFSCWINQKNLGLGERN